MSFQLFLIQFSQIEEQIYNKEMYRGKRLQQSSIINRSTLSTLGICQTTTQTIQREIDNYTRMLQQQKRRFFRLQQNQSDVLKDFSSRAKQLDTLKSREFTTETFKKKGQLKILQGELTQTINSYNEVLASNKALKTEIQLLRKEKRNQKQAMRKLMLRIDEVNCMVKEKQTEVDEKKQKFVANKKEILKVRTKNESDSRQFRDQVGLARSKMEFNRSTQYLFKRRSEVDQKSEAMDTQPLVKYRLRQALAQNKQRIRVIENYQKGMNAIWKSFQDIKQESGTSDLQEITESFLKHQQQNHFIYEYINKLNKEIEEITQAKQALAQKTEAQKELNQEHSKGLGATPEKIEAAKAVQTFKASCKERIDQFQLLLKDTQNFYVEIKGIFGLEGEEELSIFNLQQQLSQIESLIAQSFQTQECHIGLKQEATKYTKSPPLLTEEIKDKQQKLYDGGKLREYASDFWQKRRQKTDSKQQKP